jgi:DNA repair exonuclease SbcCD ATPase subunit
MSYQEALEALRAVNPGHVLLRILGASQTAGNRLILDRELAKLAVQESDTPPIGDPTTPDELDVDPVGDPVLEDLHRLQSVLFADRRKLSNSFHDCQTDGERRDVSEAIQAVQRRIEHVREQMKDYKRIGHVPAPDEKYPVPEDPFRLIALQASLRASISRKSREARDLAAAEAENDQNSSKKLPQAESKLRELQNHLERVQKAIKDRNIQPSGLRQG